MNERIKEEIRAKFNRAHHSYDQHCTIQNTICEQALDLLLQYKKQFEYISDFACGTGESTLRLIQSVQYNKCYAIDFAENLLSIAKIKLIRHNKVVFAQGDLDEELFEIPPLDLIFCNMGLQWSMSLFQTIKLFHRYLSAGGILLFSMPIAGNFPEIKPPFKLILPGHEEVVQMLTEEKFMQIEAKIEAFSAAFADQFKLLQSLKSTGTNYNKSESKNCRNLSKININKIFNEVNNTQLTYKIGIYLVRKSKP